MRERGFTMVELLVVLAIAAALLAVAPMALQRYRESTDYRDTVRTMTAALTEARHSAISGGTGSPRATGRASPRLTAPSQCRSPFMAA